MPAPKKKNPKTEPKPDLTYELEGAPPALFVVQDGAVFIGTEGLGWVADVLHAATFTEARAHEMADVAFKVVPLEDALRAQLAGANPSVLQALAALGSR